MFCLNTGFAGMKDLMKMMKRMDHGEQKPKGRNKEVDEKLAKEASLF